MILRNNKMSEVGQSFMTNPAAHPMATTAVDLSNLSTEAHQPKKFREASVRRQ